MRAFDDYLAEINRRAELVVFDQKLAAWANPELGRRAMTDDVLQRVALLYGRDSGLDALLEQASAVSTEKWIARLQRVQAHISEPEPDPRAHNIFPSSASKQDSPASPVPAV